MSDIDNFRDLVESTIVRIKKYDTSFDKDLFYYNEGYLTCLQDLLIILDEFKST